MAEIYESEFGNFVIEIAEDNFSAYLTIKPSKEFINEKELLNLIETTNISYGFDETRQMVEEKQIAKVYNSPFPFAMGVKPKDPEIEFSPLFDTEKCYRPDSGNHLKKLGDFKRIKKGEPLAHLFITKPSKAGINIYGQTVEPELLESSIIENYLGENVSYSQERGQIIAEKSGYPYMDALSLVHVKSEFTLEKNLDLTFEDLEFFGSLTVNGDIIDKVKIKVEGDLTVLGDINDAEVEVKGNINVKGDIIDCKNPGVFATGNICFTSAENSKIVAGQKIEFSRNMQFCRLVAEGGLYGHEENSSIVGGIYHSGEHIEVAVVGNTGGIGTEVEISITPFTKESMMNVTKQLNNMHEMELTHAPEYQNLQDELSNLEAKYEEEVNSMLKNLDNLPKHILAYKKVFPGTYIRILKKSIHITEELSKVSFSIVDSELTSEGY
ncbi:MAG: FapA family protein [Candidatus Cloacimonetes bacterium]|nr:FapA family protein [Candidatus Cloacimonadota bacterium]